MASIRIEDEARTDPRFVILGKRLKTTRFDARARMEELWAYCTEKNTYHLSAQVIDVLAEFEGFSELISSPEVDLAVKDDDSFYIKGTRGRIEWLSKLRKQSKKGGAATKAKRQADRLAKEEPLGEPNLGPKQGPLITVPVIAPVTVPASVFSLTEEKEKTKNLSEGKSPSAPPAVKEFIARYCDVFKTRYKTNPPITGAAAGIAKNIVKNLGLPRSLDLIEVYLSMNDQFFLTKRHDLATFSTNLNAIAVKADTGKSLSRREIQNADNADYHKNQLDRVDRGEL